VCAWVSRIPTALTRELRELAAAHNYVTVTARNLGPALAQAREALAPFRDELGSNPTDRDAPKPGLYYYRKMHDRAPGHDAMVRIAGHDHDKWQSARGRHGEKARKGIERLERGASVARLERCATCQASAARSIWRAVIELPKSRR